MKYQRAKSSFFRTKEAHLTIQAKAILHGLNDEILFPSPTPTLPILKAAIIDYESKLHKALGGSLLQREAKMGVYTNYIASLRWTYCPLQGVNISAQLMTA